MTTNKPEQTREQKLKARWATVQELQAETAKALSAVIVTAENLDFSAPEANKILGVDFIKERGQDA